MKDRISPNSLLGIMETTPADNIENYCTAVHWKSKIVGKQVRIIFYWNDLLESIVNNISFYGPLSIVAGWQKTMLEYFITKPIKTHARIAARAEISPDIFIQENEWIEQKYAKVMYDLCRNFIKEDNKFDMEKAASLSSSEHGKRLLKEYMEDFESLEKQYHSLGLTRLKAMKDLLKCILMLITEQPIDGDLPFMKKNKDGSPGIEFSKYLKEIKIRVERIYADDAFYVTSFSERITQNRIGFCKYEVVKGSEIYSVKLRHYKLPKGIKPNGKILYMVSPLINKPEIFDLAEEKSVVEGMLKEGYTIYLVDHGKAGPEETELGLDFYGKTIHDKYLKIITEKHPGQDIYIMAYCMAGTIILPYLARRAEERKAQGKDMDILKVALMASPIKFDDSKNGHKKMRDMIRRDYDSLLMNELFGSVNIPPHIIDMGMREIQHGVQYYVVSGFYGRAIFNGATQDSAPFLYWLTHGTKFPAKAHQDWINKIFIGNQIYEGTYCLPSTNPELDGKPVNIKILKNSGVTIFNYSGKRDPIAPVSSCVASEMWGQYNGLVSDAESAGSSRNIVFTRGGLNRTIEKNVGHIFVVSKKLLAEYLEVVNQFYREEI
ncbi:Alpha/beta hydrolase fold-containing [Candidatus Magnetomoraceae bacterium gMMP-15]